VTSKKPTFQGHDNIQRQITRLIVSRVCPFPVTFSESKFQGKWVSIDALDVLCAQLTRNLLAIAKFLFTVTQICVVNSVFDSVERHVTAGISTNLVRVF